MDEIEVMKSLDHDHVIKMVDYKIDESTSSRSLVFELCPNGTLFDFVSKTGHLPVPVARFYFK